MPISSNLTSLPVNDWSLEQRHKYEKFRSSKQSPDTRRQHSNLFECASLEPEVQGAIALTAVFAGAFVK